MNRCVISQDLLFRVKQHLKDHTGNAKTRAWVKRWKPVLKGGNLYKNEKLLVPKEQTFQILELAAKRGMPLGRDSAFQWLAQRYFGFKRRDVGKFIDSLETVQMMRKRPYKETRHNETQTREGTAQLLMSKKRGGHGSVGIDLTFIPRKTKNFPKASWSADDKYLYVAVVQSNNYTFAYPMKNKTAKAARDCAAKLYKDFLARYGFKITGLYMDKGTEFQEQHRTFWVMNKINPIVIDKAWWVENRNSILMRNIAAIREGIGYTWEYSLKNALLKTNDTYCRKIKAIPSAITGPQLKKGIKHYNRKLKQIPKKRKQPKFKVDQRVRTLTKSAMDVNTVLWKSYNAFRDPKTAIWTKTVSPIKEKRVKGRTMMYLVRDKWYYPYQLQLVDKVITLESDEVVVPKKPKANPMSKWLAAPKAAKPIAPRNWLMAMKNPPKAKPKPKPKPRAPKKVAIAARSPWGFAVNPVASSVWGKHRPRKGRRRR